MEWNRIAIIYENDIYGQHAMASLKERAEMNDICISYTASINTENGINSSELEAIALDLLSGQDQNPKIEGYVFFGATSTATLLLKWIDTKRIVNVPIGLFSDGIKLDLNAFKNGNSFIGKTKGSLITSPTYRVVNEFETHWKHIFTNMTKFEGENQTNPWLADVYRSLKSCDQAPCQFIPLTDEEFEANFPEQPVHMQYAIMASHAVAKTLSIVYQNICPSSSPSCDFSSRFKQGHMITHMKNINLNFTADFPLR